MRVTSTFLPNALRVSAFAGAILLGGYIFQVWRGETPLKWSPILIYAAGSVILGFLVAGFDAYFDKAEQTRSVALRWLLIVLPAVAMIALFYWMQSQ